jgi:hypothetical protein
VLVIVILGVAVFVIGFQPFGITKLAAFWAGWTALWMAAWALRGVIARKLWKRLASPTEIVLWNVCVILLLSEAALEIVARTQPSPLFSNVPKDVENLVHQKAQTAGWTFMGFPFNRQGWYDDDFDQKSTGIFRIVSISDSFVWGAAPHFHHFTTVCERLLPAVEVLNLGYSATGPDVYDYILRHHALELSPDLILINLSVGNDLYHLIAQDPHPLWQRIFDRDRLLILKVPKRLWIFWREGERRSNERDKERAVAGGTVVARPDNPLAIWQGEVVQTSRLPEEYPWLDDPELEPPTLSLESFLEIETARARSIGHPRSLGRSWEAEFFKRITRMVAGAGDIPIVFTFIPDEFQVEDDLWATVQDRIPEPLERLRAQRKLTEWFERNDVAYIDLLPHLKAVPPMDDGKRHLYHRQDTHFNRRGNEVAGNAIAQYIGEYMRVER